MSDNDGNGSISSFSNSPVNITVKTQGIESERREEDGKTRDDIYNSLSSLSEAEISSSANIDSPLNPSYSSKSSSISSISIADEGAYFSNALVLNDGEADDNVLNSGNQDLNSTTSRSDSNISSINGDANPKFQPDIEVYSSDYESASSSVSYLQTSSSPSKSNNLLDLDQSIPTILPTDLISTDQDETSVSSFVSQKTKPLSISGGSEEFQSAFSSLPVEKPFSAPFSSSSYSSSSKVSGTWSYSSCLSRDEESAIGCLKSDYSAAAPSKLSSTPNNDASENSSFKDPVFSIISSAGESENSAEYFDNYIQDGESDGEGHESTYQREEEEYDRYRAAVSEIENQFYETCVAHLGSSKRQSLNTPTRFQNLAGYLLNRRLEQQKLTSLYSHAENTRIPPSVIGNPMSLLIQQLKFKTLMSSMEPLQDQVLSDSQEDEDSSTETTRRRIETQIMRAKMEHMRRQDLKRQVSSLNYDGILNSHVSMIGEIAASLPKHSDDPNVVWDRLLKRT